MVYFEPHLGLPSCVCAAWSHIPVGGGRPVGLLLHLVPFFFSAVALSAALSKHDRLSFLPNSEMFLTFQKTFSQKVKHFYEHHISKS